MARSVCILTVVIIQDFEAAFPGASSHSSPFRQKTDEFVGQVSVKDKTN